MTRIDRVVAYLRDNGPTRPDHMLFSMPEMSKKQLLDALGNGAIKGRCHVAETLRIKGVNAGRVSVWAYGPSLKVKREKEMKTLSEPRGEYAWIGRVSSVFDLGLIR